MGFALGGMVVLYGVGRGACFYGSLVVLYRL